jgi:K+-transporting ATPase ATPase C chain
MFRQQLKTTILIFVILTVITGIIYPLVITGIAQVFFPHQANGSLVMRDGKIAGSSLIGQQFDDPKYLWGRISATSAVPYDASSSSGSNLGPTNPALTETVRSRIALLKSYDKDNTNPIPVDLVTASGSGLDPHISLAGAYYQIARIAKQRALSVDVVKDIIDRNTSQRFLGLLGEPVVNVLKVNLELDSYKK